MCNCSDFVNSDRFTLFVHYTVNIQCGYLGRFCVSVVFSCCVNQSVINDLLVLKPGVIENLTNLLVMKKRKSDSQL